MGTHLPLFLKNNRTDFCFLEIFGRTQTPFICKIRPLRAILKIEKGFYSVAFKTQIRPMDQR